MSCNKECGTQSTCTETTSNRGCGNGYVCLIVLYILLVIILSSLVIR